MFRYFLHELSDWPIAGACNAEPFGPDDDGLYLATLDATDPHCEAHAASFVELTSAGARAWVEAMAPDDVTEGQSNGVENRS